LFCTSFLGGRLCVSQSDKGSFILITIFVCDEKE
jgi:hypothetical protein